MEGLLHASTFNCKISSAGLLDGLATNDFCSLQFLFDQLPDPTLLIDPDLTVIWCNKAVAELHEACSEMEIIGKPCYLVTYGDTVPCSYCYVKDALESGQPKSFFRKMKNGRSYVFRILPLKDRSGKPAYALKTALELTEHVERTHQAQRNSRLMALGELAAGVAHEINNPINGIINYAQLLVEQVQPDSESHHLATRIISEGDRIAGIVSNLLTFARPPAPKMEDVDICALVQQCMTLNNAQFRRDGIQVQIEDDDCLPRVRGVPQQLQQVFLNLLSNSRYALNKRFPEPHPHKILRISCEEFTTEGARWVRCRIFDQGTGIPQRVMDRILDPFFTTKPPKEGTGLGLSISYNIIKEHDGLLSLRSSEGDHTEAVIELPAIWEKT